MSDSFGLPGVGGSLGTCVYCGQSFFKELILGKQCRIISLGGQDFAIHIPSCFDKLKEICIDGHLKFEQWRELPENSPLIKELQRLESETVTETKS